MTTSPDPPFNVFERDSHWHAGHIGLAPWMMFLGDPAHSMKRLAMEVSTAAFAHYTWNMDFNKKPSGNLAFLFVLPLGFWGQKEFPF